MVHTFCWCFFFSFSSFLFSLYSTFSLVFPRNNEFYCTPIVPQTHLTETFIAMCSNIQAHCDIIYSISFRIPWILNWLDFIFRGFFCLYKVLSESFLYTILQVYYELDEQRRKVEGKDVAICRVEQLCPFPYDLIQRELKRYPSKYPKLVTEEVMLQEQRTLPCLPFSPWIKREDNTFQSTGPC